MTFHWAYITITADISALLVRNFLFGCVCQPKINEYDDDDDDDGPLPTLRFDV